MKKVFLLLCFALSAIVLKAQQSEYLLGTNAGVFTFTGPSTEKVSFINTYGRNPAAGYTNNPYSSNPGQAFGISGQSQRVTRSQFLYGANLGFEILKSNTEIVGIFGDTGNLIVAATGKSRITYHHLNLYPYIGYRLPLECLHVELTGGFEGAKALKAHEKGSATDHTGNTVTTSLDRPVNALDIRGRLQLNVLCGKTGVSVSYSNGLTNYKKGWVGGVNEVYSRVLRLGLVYKIR